MARVEIKNLRYTYPDKKAPALKDLSLTIEPGEFVLVIGSSGSGKSTLLRAISGLVPSFYGGCVSGGVAIDGEWIKDMDRRDLVQKAGMVFQDPESQLVMTTPEQEVAFGLENIGKSEQVIRHRIMEMVSALSIEHYRNDFIPELSGGQKQKVALASVLAMHPDVLLLDEPTSQLDPIAGEDILTMLRRLNEENGMTIVLSEQKLERCFHFADRIIVLQEGAIVADSRDPGIIARWAVDHEQPFISSLSKLFAVIKHPVIPVTIKEGRRCLRQDFGLQETYENRIYTKEPREQVVERSSVVLENLWFTYPNGKEVLKDVSISLIPGEITAVIGANGSGKTTLIKQIAGLLKPSQGKISVLGKDKHHIRPEDMAVGYLSQNPNDYLFLPTVREEVGFALENQGIKDDLWVNHLMARLNIEKFSEMNPRDLSAGERQRVAFASVLVTKPKVLLLDEPTRGLDYQLKHQLGILLKELKEEGSTILLVAHDIEFIAEYCDHVMMMDQGTVIESGTKEAMLANGTFYSPQVSRLFQHFAPGIVTIKAALEFLGTQSTYKQAADNRR